MLPPVIQASQPPFEGAGELFAFSSALVWGVATVLFTKAIRKGSAADAVFIKNFGGAVVLGVAAMLLPVASGGGAAPLHAIAWNLLSGALGLGLGDWLMFVAFAHIGVGRTVVLVQTLPVVTALLAWFTHGEWLSPWQWVGVIGIMVGSWVAESRREHQAKTDRIGVMAALGAVAVFAIGNATLAEGMRESGVVTGACWRLVGGTLGILMIRACVGEFGQAIRTPFRAKPWKLYLVPSAIGTWGGMALFAAGFKWAPQGVAAALSAATPLISIPLAAIMLHERPGARGWIGALAVVAGAATLALAAGPQ